MADKKRKERDDGNRRRKKLKGKANVPRKKTGPHLPSSLKKEIERLNPTPAYDSDDSNEHVGDVYEFEEQQPEEESRKNKRYDPVSVNDDLSSDFEDENVQSDDENEDDDDDYIGPKRSGKAPSDDSGEEDDGRHVRMLQGITGMPSEAFEGKKMGV